MEKLRLGILGAGRIASYHMRACAQVPEIDVVAICDASRGRAEKIASEFGIEQVYDSFQELIARNSLDAVSILTWNSTHEAIAVAALEAGKHVFCEKPPSLNSRGARHMHEAAAKSGKLLMYDFPMRFSSSARALREYIKQGRLGCIYYAKAGFIRRYGNPGGWFANKELSGGGPLIDLGVHIIDIAMYMMGNPAPVSVFGHIHCGMGARSNVQSMGGYKAFDLNSGPDNVEDMADALVRFDNGASLFVEVAWTMNIKVDSLYLDLCGDQGGARLDSKLELFVEEFGIPADIMPALACDPTDLSDEIVPGIAHFANCILHGEPCISDSNNGVLVMELIDAIYRSAETGELVHLGGSRESCKT